MPKQTLKNKNQKTDTILYYVTRIMQRLALCITITLTGIYWATLINIASTVSFINNLADNSVRDRASQNSTIVTVLNMQHANILKWAVFSAALSLLLLVISRYRKEDRMHVLDSTVVAVFCLLSALLAETFIRQFLGRL